MRFRVKEIPSVEIMKMPKNSLVVSKFLMPIQAVRDVLFTFPECAILK